MLSIDLITFLFLTATTFYSATNRPKVTDQPHTSPQSQQSTFSESAVGIVTIVKVKAPWYAVDFLLNREFKKLIPTYQQVDGLRFKAFSSINVSEGKFYGGIYLWNSEAQAKKWYTPSWFTDVERRRGKKPTVDYYTLLNTMSFVDPTFDYQSIGNKGVTLFTHGISSVLSQLCLTKQPGLLRTYLVQEPNEKQGAILLFRSADDARAFLKSQSLTQYDWFKTPVFVNNGR